MLGSVTDWGQFFHSLEWIVGGITALGGLVFTTWKVAIPMFKAFKKHTDTLDSISKEFTSNGGTSMRDVLNKLSEDATVMKTDMDELKRTTDNNNKEIIRIGSRQWALVATQKDPVFEADSDGSYLRVNSMFSNLTERSYDEVKGNGWENIIHPEDRHRVVDEWDSAVQKTRAFESSFRIISQHSDKVWQITCVASPYYDDNDGKLIGYIGRYLNVRSDEAVN